MDSMRRGFYHGFNAMWLLSWIQCAVAFQVRRGFPGAPWLSRCAVAFQVRRGFPGAPWHGTWRHVPSAKFWCPQKIRPYGVNDNRYHLVPLM